MSRPPLVPIGDRDYIQRATRLRRKCTVKAIARRLGVPYLTVKRISLRPRHVGKGMSPFQHHFIRRYVGVRRRLSDKAIGQRLGLSPHTVHYWAREAEYRKKRRAKGLGVRADRLAGALLSTVPVAHHTFPIHQERSIHD